MGTDFLIFNYELRYCGGICTLNSIYFICLHECMWTLATIKHVYILLTFAWPSSRHIAANMVCTAISRLVLDFLFVAQGDSNAQKAFCHLIHENFMNISFLLMFVWFLLFTSESVVSFFLFFLVIASGPDMGRDHIAIKIL